MNPALKKEIDKMIREWDRRPWVPPPTPKQGLALRVLELKKLTYQDGPVKRYMVHPEALRRAYELVCFFPDDLPGHAQPLMLDRPRKPSGWVRISLGDVYIDVSGFGNYIVKVAGMAQGVNCKSFGEALKVLGYEHGKLN